MNNPVINYFNFTNPTQTPNNISQISKSDHQNKDPLLMQRKKHRNITTNTKINVNSNIGINLYIL